MYLLRIVPKTGIHPNLFVSTGLQILGKLPKNADIHDLVAVLIFLLLCKSTSLQYRHTASKSRRLREIKKTRRSKLVAFPASLNNKSFLSQKAMN